LNLALAVKGQLLAQKQILRLQCGTGSLRGREEAEAIGE
jgi:hypothetical protein